jgi:Flp pilus assembly protein TadG
VRSERGQVTVLVLGLALVAFAVAGVAIDGTRAFLFRRALQDVADAAVLAGAGEIDTSTYYRTGGREVIIDAAAARNEVAKILALRGLDAQTSVVADSDAVSVIVRGEVSTTFLGVVGIEKIPVATEARAAPFEGAPR